MTRLPLDFPPLVEMAERAFTELANAFCPDFTDAPILALVLAILTVGAT